MTAKPVTGQYECVHSSGVGLDYFTSRIDQLVLHADGRFVLTEQSQSRAVNAAHHFIKGEQVNSTAPQQRREGSYTLAGETITLNFLQEPALQGQLSWNGEGIQLGPNFFTKVSDSTFLPPTHRMKKDMDDIAKGLKIAGTIGGFAMKAAKGIQSTIQATQSPGIGPDPSQPAPPPVPPQQPGPMPGSQTRPYQPPQQPPAQPAAYPPPAQSPQTEAHFCDQCGARSRPGKRFCNNCGAPLS